MVDGWDVQLELRWIAFRVMPGQQRTGKGDLQNVRGGLFGAARSVELWQWGATLSSLQLGITQTQSEINFKTESKEFGL